MRKALGPNSGNFKTKIQLKNVFKGTGNILKLVI